MVKIAEDDELKKEKILNFVSPEGDIYILGEFDETIGLNILPSLHKLIACLSTVNNAKLTFYINSNGGYAHELYNLLSAIETAKKNNIIIETIVYGRAYSCASLLAVHGTKGYRKIFRYGQHLAHLGSQSMTTETFKQTERGFVFAMEQFNAIQEMYTRNTKMLPKMLKKSLEDDNFFLNASDCIKYGFADEII